MSMFTREKATARLVGEAGMRVTYKYDPSSGFKWRAKLHHPTFDYGYDSEIGVTQWGLNLAIRRVARRVIKAQAMQFRADQMTKAVAS